jgi:hypothetical protein
LLIWPYWSNGLSTGKQVDAVGGLIGHYVPQGEGGLNAANHYFLRPFLQPAASTVKKKYFILDGCLSKCCSNTFFHEKNLKEFVR